MNKLWSTRRAPCGVLVIVLTACRVEPAAPAVDATEVAPPAPVAARSTRPPARNELRLCRVLAGVAATEAEGFARLRDRPLAAGRWLGRETLPGTERCTIEGEAWPGARYSCAGAAFAATRREAAEGAFDALADELDRCLDSPIWFPRAWQRGNDFEFAMGERLQAWTDHSTSPPSQVVLKMQQDATGHFYRVQLDLAAVP